MKTICITILAVILYSCCYAQTQTIHGTEIPLCCGLDSSQYEYSGLAKWKNKVLLIPQYPDKWENALFAVDSIDIDKAITRTPANGTPYTRITISNLDDVRKQMKGTYQGFEGAVVIGNAIFFTLEFSEQTCYLLKGYIRELNGKTSIELQKPYAIEKLKDAYVNAGYESIGYLPGSKTLSVFFEKNSDTKQSSVLLVDTSFKKPPQQISFQQPMFFRLTDVAASGRNSFIGINHYYNDYHRRQKEYNYYVGSDNLEQAAAQMNGASPADSNYTAIVQLTQKSNRIEWTTKKFISFGDENWEGIVLFKKGFLMVVDEYPKDGSPRMRYFEW